MIFLPVTESTNKYAMELIADGMAEHGTVVWTKHQFSGRGQRGKVWDDEVGKSVLMSLIIGEHLHAMDIFKLGALVAVSVRRVLHRLLPKHQVEIKWPNDIYLDQKKVCGILIENTFRGHQWHYAVVGIGINVLQENFATTYTACSMLSVSGLHFSLEEIIEAIRQEILQEYEGVQAGHTDPWVAYNANLYKQGARVQFEDLQTREIFKAKIETVDVQGRLRVEMDGQTRHLAHGTVRWILV